MAGMYPENEDITIFGERVQWPGVDKSGKFTNGSFSDPHEPPSFIPANTINLILDNLSSLITKLGGIPNNSSDEQLAGVFASDIKAFAGIMRDGAGRAKVAAPTAADDIARKAEIDTEKEERTQAVSSLSQAFHQSINAESNARSNGDNALAQSIAVHTGNKGNPHGVTAKQIGLERVNNTPDNEKRVKYAESAGSAKANGGNADTVGTYKAGNGVNMLVPVVAFNVGKDAGYIKLGNGLIVQWGRLFPKTTRATLVLPIPYSKWNSYSVVTADADGLNIDNDVEGYDLATGINKRTEKSIDFSIASSRREVHWLCIGY